MVVGYVVLWALWRYVFSAKALVEAGRYEEAIALTEVLIDDDPVREPVRHAGVRLRPGGDAAPDRARDAPPGRPRAGGHVLPQRGAGAGRHRPG